MAPARISCAQLVWRHGESSLEKSHNSSGTDVARAGQRRSPHCPHLSPNTPWGWSWARKKENGKRFWGERRCYCRCLGYCRVLPKRRRREGERQWGKGNICQALEEADGGDGRESACGMSPVRVGLVPSLGRFLSAPALGHTSLSKPRGALCQPGGSGQGRVLWLPREGSQGFGSIVHHHPQCSALAGTQPGLLCHHARRPSCHLSCPQAVSHLQPGLAGGHSDPSSTGRGMLALPGLAGGAACL